MCYPLFFDRDHLRSNMGIISGPGSFAVQFGDHLRSRIICGPGITCGPVQACVADDLNPGIHAGYKEGCVYGFVEDAPFGLFTCEKSAPLD